VLELFLVSKILSLLDRVVAGIELLVMHLGAGANVLTCVGKKSVRAEANKRHFANIIIPEVLHCHIDAIAVTVAAEKFVQRLDKPLIVAISRHSLLREGAYTASNQKPVPTPNCADLMMG
jgi:hypothetical protein